LRLAGELLEEVVVSILETTTQHGAIDESRELEGKVVSSILEQTTQYGAIEHYIVPTLQRGNASTDAPASRNRKLNMARSRYVITEPDKPHFLTCTVLEWLPVFSRPEAVDILLDCWRYQIKENGLQLYGYVVMENHIHYIAQAKQLDKSLASFKSFTARRIIDYLILNKTEYLLDRFRFAKRPYKNDREYQFWQEGSHAELVFSEAMMREKLEYIHANPVTRGYVDLPEHWRYSSARNYSGEYGLLDVNLCW
jgi:REP element-mobilizing transposase RayT